MLWLLLMSLSVEAFGAEPIVIAHRGHPGTLPEHTLEGYSRAVELGADFIEPDLVITRDGVLVARHENEISATTNVKLKFPERRKTRVVDGKELTGWFTEDFTVAELKTLRARQPLDFRPSDHDDQYAIPTFMEILELRAQLSEQHDRPIGVYPETKHPSYFRSIGLPLEELLLTALTNHGLTRADDPVFIQSFEVGNLKRLSRRTALPLVQLVYTEHGPWDHRKGGPNYAEMITPDGLRTIATYAAGIGPHKSQILPLGKDGALGPATTLIEDAHAAGLVVHAYTFRSEDAYLPATHKGDPVGEARAFIEAGLDGLFCDFAEVGVEAREGKAGNSGGR